jgi:hypothetical protein
LLLFLFINHTAFSSFEGEFWMWEMESQITRLMRPSVLHALAHATETHAHTHTITSHQGYFLDLAIIKHLSSFWQKIKK